MSGDLHRFVDIPGGDMQPSDFASPDAFTTADKTERNHFFHATLDHSVLAGIWECAPTREVIGAYPVNEMMTILSGSVTVTRSKDNTAETFTAGDTFFIAKGTACVWEITETLRKYYFIAS